MNGIQIVQSFATGIVTAYVKAGEPSLDDTLVVLMVNPMNPADGFSFVGSLDEVNDNLEAFFPFGGIVRDKLKEAVEKLSQVPANGLLRVVVSTVDGIELIKMSLHPRASA